MDQRFQQFGRYERSCGQEVEIDAVAHAFCREEVKTLATCDKSSFAKLIAVMLRR
jgi:hypothetical protein